MDLAAGQTAPATSAFGRSQPRPHSLTPSPVRHNAPGHICTVTLEDYFHAAPLRPWVRTETWYRFDSRLAESTRRTLDFLETCKARATFFVGADLVESTPGLIREIAARGHELAVRGDLGTRPRDLGPARMGEEVLRARDRLEQVVGHRVFGYRAAAGWLQADELWLLRVLADAGYLYDSSVRAALLSHPLRVRDRADTIPRGFHEMAVSSVGVCGIQVPVGGGAALRLMPQVWLRRVVARWNARGLGPYVACLRPWELDLEQPRISGASAAVRLRQYRNLERMPARLRDLLTGYPFTSVAGHLGLQPTPVAVRSPHADAASPPSERLRSRWRRGPTRQPSGQEPKRVTVIVPCYNETASLRNLHNTLGSVAAAFEGEFAFTFLFVDDRSTDGTWALLQELFGGRSDCMLVRHDRNRGIAAAIQTGLRHAPTDIACSMDCDCTYDPHELGHMIPLLVEGVDVVTASPYHPAGSVRNVPGWRLALSKTLSGLYRIVLRQKLFTYTSCFRVYRKSSAVALEVQRPGFLGVAELIARLDLAGRRVVEYPTTLEVRVLGHSNMKVARTVWGHLGLLLDVAWARLSRNGTSVSAASL